jgi:hypothetical protein
MPDVTPKPGEIPFHESRNGLKTPPPVVSVGSPPPLKSIFTRGKAFTA